MEGLQEEVQDLYFVLGQKEMVIQRLTLALKQANQRIEELTASKDEDTQQN